MIKKLLRNLGLSPKAAKVVDAVVVEAADTAAGGKLKKAEKIVKKLT